jgi:hypothetical protein
MATRIQGKSRVAKKVIGKATFDLFDSTIVWDSGKQPKFDHRGYPAYKGLPAPVLVGITIVDTTP